MIVYDQDKTMVISENLGDVIFVKEFEKFIKGTGFSIYLCKGYDPSTKGKVEKTVDFVKHKLVGGKGNVVTLPNIEKAPPSIEELLLKDFSKHDDANRFIKRMREQKLRYVYSQCRKLEKMRKYYSDKKIVEGMKYCLNIDVCTIFELSSWLVMDMGIDIAKPYLSSYTIRHYKDRALEIEKELKENGRS